MLVTISTTHQPATDLGYLLHKHPNRAQTFELSRGRAHLFYPEASDELCTAALLLELDPIALSRGLGRGRQERTFALKPYVNDRPYVTSSFVCAAISRVLGSALNGQSRERPTLATRPIPLEITLHALPCRGARELVHRLFEPLGFHVEADRAALDETRPDWGESPYYNITLRSEALSLAQALTRIYVLIPVLDGDKHYYIGQDEVEKLLQKGEGWLDEHPERELIATRYLGRRRALVRAAMDAIVEDDESPTRTSTDPPAPSIHARRLEQARDVIASTGASSVLDLGCGEGKLLRLLSNHSQFSKITGVDVSPRCLEIAAKRLKLEHASERKRQKITLLQSSLVYRDERLTGYDVATLIEVIEHVDPSRLGALERAVFEFARPRHVLVTTPNREYNATFEQLSATEMRHRDHRFEFDRAEFSAWAASICERHDYTSELIDFGDTDPEHGPITQGVLFTQREQREVNR